MRILALAPHPFYQERGTPIATRLLATALAEAGHRIDLLCYHEGRDVAIDGVTIHRAPAPPGVSGVRPGFSAKKLRCDRRMLGPALALARAGRHDVVHATEEAVFMAMLIKRRLGLPYVYDMDSCLSQQVGDKFGLPGPARRLMAVSERAALRGAAGVVAVCQALEETALAAGPGGPVLRLEDISLLDQEPDAGAGEPEPLRAPPGQWVMYVGNLEPYQGMDLLLEAFARAAPGHPQAQLVVVGGAEADIAAYRAKAEALGLAGRAHFQGPRPPAHLGHYLTQAAVVASPRTVGDNTPMKVYSYLDCGRPLLATRLPTHTQVLDDQVAMLAEPRPEAMAQALDKLLGDEALRERLARAAKARAAARHSWPVFRDKIVGFYDDLARRLA